MEDRQITAERLEEIMRKRKSVPAVSVKRRASTRRRRRRVAGILAGAAIAGIGCTVWLGVKGSIIKDELDAATALAAPLKTALSASDRQTAESIVTSLREHTSAAREAAGDPIWTLASTVPGLGSNLSAVSEIARSADDVASLGLAPLIKVFTSFDWHALLPSSSGTALEPLEAASPTLLAAANAVNLSADRLAGVDQGWLLPEVAEPLARAKDELGAITGTLQAAADAARVAPGMLGAEAPRRYLLMIQNNAEVRASGGIPGALAVLTLSEGKLSLDDQSNAGEIGTMSPALPLDPEQEMIYSDRLGKFMQDVNLTPDFPTAASTAKAMWERKTGQSVDGVLSIDPIALGYILDATGPITLSNPELRALTGERLPTRLTGENVVKTLLSDVYAKIDRPELQDTYFEGVAQDIFAALASGKSDPKAMIAGITKGSSEGRVMIWSTAPAEQTLIEKYKVSGSITGKSVAPAQFGIFFNDGTGAKMDYYVHRTVQLVKECPSEGYGKVTVRVTSTNTAPTDAATSLPAYVTGDGKFGVPPGFVQTNLIAYGPVQANVETAKTNGQSTEFAPYSHSNRPVGVLAVKLAPGESKTVDFIFGKIVQHTEPTLVVTPTAQSLKDVTLPAENVSCG